MDAGSILLIMALVVGVSFYVSQPFFTRQASKKLVPAVGKDMEVDHLRSALLAEHERVLSALQELEFDYALGKIPAEDYPSQRTALLHTGAKALRQLDELDPGAQLGSAEERIEAMVAARRYDGQKEAGPAADTGDELENLIAARRRARHENGAGFCAKCGRPLQKSDRFCSRCGATINT